MSTHTNTDITNTCSVVSDETAAAAAFTASIKPFFWIHHRADNSSAKGEAKKDSYSTCLCVDAVPQSYVELFKTREADGFEGNGYDWTSLADAFLTKYQPEAKGIVNFDPEGSMFCAYSDDGDTLRRFLLGFKAVCDDAAAGSALLAEAELD